MKVMAVNSSPRVGVASKTEMLLERLVTGMRQAGAEVTVVNLKDKKIHFCRGCFSCWSKSPGVCIQQDDMTRELFPLWRESDIAVYASPLYHFTLNAQLKAFIERTLPALEPFMVEDADGTSHPWRFRPPRLVFLSVAGFPEDTVFAPLSHYVRTVFNRGVMAEIYRAGAEALPMAPRAVREDVLAAVERAGRELVEEGAVSEQTQARIRQPLGEVKDMQAMANLFWRTCIAEKVSPLQFAKRGLIPRPESLEEFLLLMKAAFDPQAAGDFRAVIQFEFSGRPEGVCHLRIAEGKLTTSEGPAAEPDLVIRAPFATWLEIMAGRRDGQQALMQGEYQAEGDLAVLMGLGAALGGA